MSRRPGWACTAAAAAAAGVVLAACSVPDQGTPVFIGGASTTQPSAVTEAPSPRSTLLEVYLVDSTGRLSVVRRSDPYMGLNSALGELLAGPTREELAVGLTSAIPVGTKLTYAAISGDTADLDFSSSLASVTGHEQLLAFAQIVLTATSIPGVDQVQIAISGQTVNAPQPDGTLAQGPVTAGNYSGLLAG